MISEGIEVNSLKIRSETWRPYLMHLLESLIAKIYMKCLERNSYFD